ncbi:MAG: hypothetical protein J0L92_12010 [Deltaproteobacteria bacterium]|nr:hypothetical protein [Deltaproteobacteria bacterium]
MTRAEERREPVMPARQASSGPRSEDHALLARLEAELALAAALEGTGLEGLPQRASGVVERLRDNGETAIVEDALQGHGEPLRVRLFRGPLRPLPPDLVHHLAVLADHALEIALEGSRAERAHALPLHLAIDRAMHAWLEVGRAPEAIAKRARDAAPPGLSLARVEEVARALPVRGIERVSTIAREGLVERTHEGHVAALALRDLLEDLPTLALPASLEARATGLVRSAIEELASHWLVRFRDALDTVLARDWTAPDATKLFADAAKHWEWSGEEPELERHVLTALPELAWPLYRKRSMRELGEMLAPIMPMAWALEARVLAARKEGQLDRDLAYVAPCAQALVFWAEIPREVDAALPRIERAYALCPTLRNARIVLAHVLCDRAEHTLARREIFPTHPARADIERAASVFPELSRLEALKKRVGIP